MAGFKLLRFMSESFLNFCYFDKVLHSSDHASYLRGILYLSRTTYLT